MNMDVMADSGTSGRLAAKRPWPRDRPEGLRESYDEGSATLETRKRRLDSQQEMPRPASSSQVRSDSRLSLDKAGMSEPKKSGDDCVKFMSHVKFPKSRYNNVIIPVLPQVFSKVKHG